MKPYLYTFLFLVLLSTSESYGQSNTQPDSCITPYSLQLNSVVENGTTTLKEGCFEVVLDEGFIAEYGSDFTAQVGNSGSDGTPLITMKHNGVNSNAGILLLLQAKSDRVNLRWIPDKETDWEIGSKSGYSISKEEFVSGAWQSVAMNSLTGLSESAETYWTASGKDSTYTIIFDATFPGDTPLNSEDAEDDFDLFFRYLSANTAYNSNFQAATESGHGFVDNNVLTGRKYRYKVHLLNDVNVSTGDWIEIEISNNSSMPESDVTLVQSENQQLPTVSIDWQANNMISFYGSYDILRSKNGGSYQKINNYPIIYNNVTTNDDLDDSTSIVEAIEKIYFTDNLPNETATYEYKVVGRSYFSDGHEFTVKSLTVKRSYLVSPAIDSVFTTVNGSKQINWRFPDTGNDNSYNDLLNDDGNAWQIMVAQKDSGYVAASEPQPRLSRSYELFSTVVASLIDTSRSRFYKVYGITVDGDTLQSYPFMFIPEDHTPPAKPTGFILDTLELVPDEYIVVQLRWNLNTERDLEGYLVKRKIGKNDSLYVIKSPQYEKYLPNSAAIRPVLQEDDLWAVDTIALNVTYPDFYYVLCAVDANNNESDSTQIRYVMPDTKRPFAPIITSIRQDTVQTNQVSVVLTFTRSPESGVIHKLFKSSDGQQQQWVELTAFDDAMINDPVITEFTDDDITTGDTYYYSLLTYDSSNNQSCFSEKLSSFDGNYSDEDCFQIVPIDLYDVDFKKDVISTLTNSYDAFDNVVELEWEINSTYEGQIKEYEIYKATYQSTIPDPTSIKKSLLQIVNKNELQFTDKVIEKGKVNKYLVRAILEDGTMSAFKEITVSL